MTVMQFVLSFLACGAFAVLFLMGLKIMADFTALTQAVIDNTTATNAAIAKITTLPTDTDQASVDAVTTQITANTAALNGAVAPTTGA